MEKPHYKLEVWRDAIELAKLIYRYTAKLPDDERFGLISQMRRSSVSIASNIAEGVARGSTADCIRFLNIARGSLSELDTQIVISQEIGGPAADGGLLELVDRVYAKLNALINKLSKKLA